MRVARVENGLHRVERAGADVAEDNPECADTRPARSDSEALGVGVMVAESMVTGRPCPFAAPRRPLTSGDATAP